MNARFALTGTLTSALGLLLNGAAYALVLKGFYQSHPAGPPEFVGQLHREPGQLVGWALAVSALAMGFLVTVVMRWSGTRTFLDGLRRGTILGLLFWACVNFGLFASSHVFSQAAALVDWVCSALCMALCAAFAAWMLGRGPAAASAR
jgi:hypothetical protein